MADTSGTRDIHGARRAHASARSNKSVLRTLAVVCGIFWSVVFVVVGLSYRLEMYGDGSIFSYAVAVQDAWAFHWHNISGRLFVYLYAHLPSEAYVALTGNARGGVAVYGFLFFAAPLFGLIATYAADRSKDRIVFVSACASTACLCPLVFGFPTEVWVAHAVFWPALAICHYGRGGAFGMVMVFAMLLALVFTHAGALLFAGAILVTLAVRGARDPAFLRAVGAFFLAMAVWSAVKRGFPPDDYLASVLLRAALHVFDISILSGSLVMLLLIALASYAVAFVLLKRQLGNKAHVYAAWFVTAALASYWVWFDQSLHAENRYYLRTVLLVLTPAFGAFAATSMLAGEGRLPALLSRLHQWFTDDAMACAVAGAFALVMLVHTVETAKFVTAWKHYTDAMQRLAMGEASDPALGNHRFVSSQRIRDDLNRVSWFSTTPYLSVLASPNLAPKRLVIDPASNFFWLSCATATANFRADRAVPADSRDLIRLEACRHLDR